MLGGIFYFRTRQMKKIVFTEEFCQPENLFPFTLTRQIQDIRVGILTIREKWEQWLGLESFDKKEGDYKDLDRSIEIGEINEKDVVYLIHGNILPTAKLVKQIKKLKTGQFISVPEKESIIYCISQKEIVDSNKIKVTEAIEFSEEFKEITFPWEIFQMNNWAIEQDFELLTQGRRSQKISSTNKPTKAGNIFIEKGAHVEYCFLNATDGPIYIGKNAVVMEGSMLRGPVAICDNAVVKMGSKIYGATTIGPNCTVGGEIKNAVFFANSNKAHDGYIGDSVIGEWCNMGAGTSNSNIKNTASSVMLWTPGGAMNVGMKCGVMMGDYSRTAINTSINTGTVIGVCCNVFGTGLTPKYIPNFSWGADGIERYQFDKALSDIGNWKQLKHQSVSQNEEKILKHVFEHW
jgi:UDP-N-acetylglucosamine diphosphorylase / glucose-1-phosphate thymidylyltransferase / UDP-N-acetylgalactosamine diphosphorylase / glucosamine-1-phosphate N-acetyltransferase / galactosamine-1-phosphate N-acetyltransferase